MAWFLYAVALPLGLLVVASAACALHWAAKHGQTGALWQSIRSRFEVGSPEPTSDEMLAPPAPSNRAPQS